MLAKAHLLDINASNEGGPHMLSCMSANNALKMLSRTLCGFFIGWIMLSESKAVSSIVLYDDSFTVLVDNSPVNNRYMSALWGTYNNGIFTPLPNGTGYVDTGVDFLEMQINYSKIDNSELAVNEQIALAIYDVDLINFTAAPYNSNYIQTILTDVSWRAPPFDSTPNMESFSFSSNTTALVGTFNYNGGSEIIGVVPEPNTFLLLVIGAVFLGFMKTKNKTKASLLAALLAIFSLNTTHAAVLGIEDASSYTTATWIEGAGTSVGTWYFQNDTSAITQIGDSSQGGRTSIGTDAFNFVPGNTAWNQFANGWFVLNGGGLITGQTLSVDANYLWNGGNRGVEFMSGNTAVFRFQHVWSDPITFAGTGLTDTQVLANGYQQALTYSVDQLDQLSVQVSAYLYGDPNALFTQTVAVPDYITGIHFYAGDIQTTTADQPNYGLFVNNIEVSGIPEPSAGSLMLLGGLGILAMRTLKRKEDNV